MSANKECYRELIGLLDDLSPTYIYSLLDGCMYDLILVADQLESTEGLAGKYIALKQLRDMFGQPLLCDQSKKSA